MSRKSGEIAGVALIGGALVIASALWLYSREPDAGQPAPRRTALSPPPCAVPLGPFADGPPLAEAPSYISWWKVAWCEQKPCARPYFDGGQVSYDSSGRVALWLQQAAGTRWRFAVGGQTYEVPPGNRPGSLYTRAPGLYTVSWELRRGTTPQVAGTYVWSVPAGCDPVPPPPPPGLIFRDGFESGNTSAWSATVGLAGLGAEGGPLLDVALEPEA